MNSMELSLVLFTVFAQTAIGLTLMGAVKQWAAASGERAVALPEWIVTAGFLAVGLVAGLFHLGHPTGAVRTLAGLGASWMSREVLTLLVLAALLVVTGIAAARAAPALGLLIVTALAGVAVLVAQGFAYAPPSYPALNNAAPFAFFALTAVLCGASISAWFASEDKQPLLAWILATALVTGLALYLVVPCVWASGGTVMEATGRAFFASPLYWARVGGGLVLPLAVLAWSRRIPAWLPLLILAGELVGRTLLFSHVVHTAANLGGLY
ncbi:MAG: dimethyl sulfoxide reductase anchor subunit family protein [Deferrisomatales bacterium]